MKTLIKLIVFVIVIQSCETSKETKQQMLQESSGQLAEVVVITDKKSLDSSYKEEIRIAFGAKIEGLPYPSEPRFKVIFTDETFFKGYIKDHFNVFILLTRDNLPKMSKFYGEKNQENIEKVIDNEDALGIKKADIWAKNQKVFYVTAKNKNAMLAKLQNRKDDFLNLAIEQEQAVGSNKLFSSINRDTFYTRSLKSKGFSVRRPSSYRVAMNNAEFAWLRKVASGKEQQMNVLLFEEPYVSKEQLSTQNLLAIRNKYTKKYIPGRVDGSFMKHTNALEPVRSEFSYNGSYGVEIRAWWDMQGDWMGGPLMFKAVVDEQRKRIVFAEGFLYYPNEKKAKPFRELEIILNSLKVND